MRDARTITALGVSTLAAVSLTVAPARADSDVFHWNETAFAVTAAGGQNPIVISRSVAMTQLAVHDALNAIDRRYEPYLSEGPAHPAAAPAAAIAAAAHDVLVGVLPGFGTEAERANARAMVEGEYAAALARIPAGPAKDHGIAAGREAARAILTARRTDGATADMPYVPGAGPGQWQPHPNPVPANPPVADPALAAGNLAAVLPQWALVTPFTMAAPWQFRLDGPPGLQTAGYARDYGEVKRLGAKGSTERTAVQSEIARYWYEGSPQGWSRIARTAADPAWESYLNTPALPDYPSTHSVAGGAAAAILARFFGTDEFAFTMTSGPPFAGITRSFTSFSQAAQENADSRVYAGINFRSACQDGILLGTQIGRRAFAQQLPPYRE